MLCLLHNWVSDILAGGLRILYTIEHDTVEHRNSRRKHCIDKPPCCKWKWVQHISYYFMHHVIISIPLQWPRNELPGVSNHQRLDRLFNRLFRLTSKKTSKPALLAFCEGNSPVTGGVPPQRASNATAVPFDEVLVDLSDGGMWEYIFDYEGWVQIPPGTKGMCINRNFPINKWHTNCVRLWHIV